MLLSKIISGGQTGVDRAALDAAMKLGIPAGGYCPQGRKAEDGPIDPCYPLQELNSPHYPARTERNVLESDGTLIINEGALKGGVALTLRMAKKHKKHFLVIDPSKSLDVSEVIRWVKSNRLKALNVAGPRESNSPGIYDKAFSLLLRVIHNLCVNIP
jgi:predicted Rossmann-fold nucleotide-binding protein